MTQDEFRWQALFQRTPEPLFLLNRQRRILFVNRAWEELTGVSAAQARGLSCARRKPARPAALESLAHALHPPMEVLHGTPGRARRLVPGVSSGRRWWDVEFFPLQDQDGLLAVLGKVRPVAAETPAGAAPLPEKLMALRQAIAGRYGFEQLASELPVLRRIVTQVRLACQTRVPVLIAGEPGTGKRSVARTIHHLGCTREETFAALDCSGLPSTAIESALFGAHGLARRPGVGTIYLQNLVHLPRDLQAQLADLLGEVAEAPSGESAGPRWIAGCGSDVAEEVREGRLLGDLYCSLGTVVIALPPLRERLPDLPALVDAFLRRPDADPSAPQPNGLSPEAWEFIEGYSWPGNLRELAAVLAAARRHATGEHIEAADLPAPLRLAVRLEQTPGPQPERSLPLDHLLEQAERRLIQLALRLARGNRSRAAEILAVWRPRLQRRIEALEIAD
jgi:DNA-binding NtrC family response regulator